MTKRSKLIPSKQQAATKCKWIQVHLPIGTDRKLALFAVRNETSKAKAIVTLLDKHLPDDSITKDAA